jgi:HSP20 family molecular chaperone IbpA
MNEKQSLAQKRQPENEIDQAGSVFRMSPAVDIYETDEELVLMANLPGVEDSGLQLEVARGVLTLTGEIQTSDNEAQRGYYQRFKLSDRIDADAGNAALKDGVLTLRLPKSDVAKPRKIAVTTRQ